MSRQMEEFGKEGLMENKKRDWLLQAGGFGIAGVAACLLGSDLAMARDLGSAAKTYTSTIKLIGQGMSVAGVVAGGICMQLPGVAQFGKSVLAGGLVGGLCSFGAPAFVSLLTTVFGGG